MSDVMLQPLGTPEEFHQMLVELATDYAPRRFAICEEYGDRIDGRIFAWGLAFGEAALVSTEDARLIGQLTQPESAVRIFSRGGRRMRLIWIDEPTGDVD